MLAHTASAIASGSSSVPPTVFWRSSCLDAIRMNICSSVHCVTELSEIRKRSRASARTPKSVDSAAPPYKNEGMYMYMYVYVYLYPIYLSISIFRGRETLARVGQHTKECRKRGATLIEQGRGRYRSIYLSIWGIYIYLSIYPDLYLGSTRALRNTESLTRVGKDAKEGRERSAALQERGNVYVYVYLSIYISNQLELSEIRNRSRASARTPKSVESAAPPCDGLRGLGGIYFYLSIYSLCIYRDLYSEIRNRSRASARTPKSVESAAPPCDGLRELGGKG